MGLSRLRGIEGGSLIWMVFCRPDSLNSKKSEESVESRGAPINIMPMCGALRGLGAFGFHGNLLAATCKSERYIWVDDLAS